MLDIHSLVVAPRRQGLGLAQRFLRFFGQTIDVHDSSGFPVV